MIRLSIIIPCYNKWNFTQSILNDLSKLPNDHEIIVVDNDSSDETYSKLINSKEIIYIRNNENLFHSKACNQGYKISSGDNVLFLNNDVRVKSNHTTWTDSLLKYCNNSIVGTSMGILDDDFNFIKEAPTQLNGNTYLAGWCISSSRQTWDKLDISGNDQIWNEKYPFYFNDTDLGFRCKKQNIDLKVVQLPLVHFGKISASQINIRKAYLEGRDVFLQDWKTKIKS